MKWWTVVYHIKPNPEVPKWELWKWKMGTRSVCGLLRYNYYYRLRRRGRRTDDKAIRRTADSDCDWDGFIRIAASTSEQWQNTTRKQFPTALSASIKTSTSVTPVVIFSVAATLWKCFNAQQLWLGIKKREYLKTLLSGVLSQYRRTMNVNWWLVQILPPRRLAHPVKEKLYYRTAL